jgi:hypothetical protein
VQQRIGKSRSEYLGCLEKPYNGDYLLDGVDVKTKNREELAW